MTLVELQRRASHLFRLGSTDEAIQAYQALLARDRSLPNAWFNLAMLQRRARRYDDALASYQEALNLGIDEPEEVHLQRAVIYSDDLDRSDLAFDDLAAALALNPCYIPALLNLGNLYEDRGDWPAARAALTKVLGLEPGNVLALARMIGLAQGVEESAALLARALAIIASATATDLDRADLGFAVGNLLDRQADYEGAFDAYVQANRSTRAIWTRSGAAYDRSGFSNLVDRLIAAFPAEGGRGPSSGQPAPIFICGMYRSGSTLLEQILSRHSTVVAGGELDLIPHLAASLVPYPGHVANLSDVDVAELRQSYLAATAPRHAPGTLITDKNPENFLHIGLIGLLFPGAIIVHTTRNPLDNALSLFFLHGGSALNYATDFSDIAHYYTEYRRLMRHWRTLDTVVIHDVDYDMLVVEPAETLAPLLAALQLDPEDVWKPGGGRQTSVRTASNWQVRQPLYRHASGRWRNYASHLTDLHAALRPALEGEHR